MIRAGFYKDSEATFYLEDCSRIKKIVKGVIPGVKIKIEDDCEEIFYPGDNGIEMRDKAYKEISEAISGTDDDLRAEICHSLNEILSFYFEKEVTPVLIEEIKEKVVNFVIVGSFE